MPFYVYRGCGIRTRIRRATRDGRPGSGRWIYSITIKIPDRDRMLEEQYESELRMFTSREGAIEAARLKGEEIIRETYLSNRSSSCESGPPWQE